MAGQYSGSVGDTEHSQGMTSVLLPLAVGARCDSKFKRPFVSNSPSKPVQNAVIWQSTSNADVKSTNLPHITGFLTKAEIR